MWSRDVLRGRFSGAPALSAARGRRGVMQTVANGGQPPDGWEQLFALALESTAHRE